MPSFEYAALDANGLHQKGISEGDTERQIRQNLRSKGLMPLSVQPIKQKKTDSTPPFWSRKRIPAAEISLMTRQLATLIRSGMPLDDTLQALSEQVEHAEVRRMVLNIRNKVTEGYSLSEAMEQYQYALSDLYIATISAGEHSRDLALVLERLADYTENQQAMNQKIRLAMLYPTVLAIAAILVSAGLLIYVIPEVVQVFEHSDQQLPFITRALISLSEFLQNWWVLIAFTAVAFFSVSKFLLKNEKIRLKWHGLLLQLPLVKNLIRQSEAARFTRTLGILLASGVSMLEALKIGCRAITSLPIKQAVAQASIKVAEGVPLHKALRETRKLPPLTIHLIANGEASGKLESMLDNAAEAHDRNLQSHVSMLLGLLEPVLILLMGGIVLTIVIAILLPIFELNQLV